MGIWSRTGVWVASCVVVAVTACGVPPGVVAKEANMIKKNAGTAAQLHARCVDAGPDADPSTVSALCAQEEQSLMDIQSNADTLLKAAGVKDAGAADGGHQ